MKNLANVKTVAVHDGTYHADDVFAGSFEGALQLARIARDYKEGTE